MPGGGEGRECDQGSNFVMQARASGRSSGSFRARITSPASPAPAPATGTSTHTHCALNRAAWARRQAQRGPRGLCAGGTKVHRSPSRDHRRSPRKILMPTSIALCFDDALSHKIVHSRNGPITRSIWFDLQMGG